MTDSEKGLPTAAIVNGNEAGHFLVWQDYGYESSDVGDELVRKTDVKALIQEKIDRLGIENPHSNWRKEELKELLEELKQ